MASAAPTVSSPSGTPGPGTLAPAPSVSGPAPTPLSGELHFKGTTRVANVRALEWTAQGFTKVVGNVEVATGDITGSLAVGGGIQARQLSLAGDHQVVGDLRIAGVLRTRGTFRSGANVGAQTAHLAGTVEVGGSLTVTESLEWNGTLGVGQDVRADTVLFRGQLTVPGRLTGRSISGQIDRLSSVREIQADWVDIRRRKALLPFPVPILPPPAWQDLEVQRIEANEVHLAGVRVRQLKANRIWLGPDTHVEYVEGTIVERHKNAHVGPESESPPPPGLSR